MFGLHPTFSPGAKLTAQFFAQSITSSRGALTQARPRVCYSEDAASTRWTDVYAPLLIKPGV